MLLVSCLAGACTREDSPPDASTQPPAPPTVAAVAAPASPTVQRIDADQLRTHVEWLASDRLRGRNTPSPQLDLAADYIHGHFAELGLHALPETPDHQQRFECGGPDHPGLASNVIALLPGRDPALAEQRVMVSAHYDHVGDHGDGADSIFNGANDNASGTAAMLAIAQALATAARPPRRSVVFVAFCGEERGLLGSYHLAEHPLLPLEGIVAQLNLEMVGRPGPGEPLTSWITGMSRSDLGTRLSAASQGMGVTFVDGTEIGHAEGNAFHRSDNYPLALQGVVAHTISTGRLDALYHSPDDEADTLDYERMAVLIRAIAQATIAVANADGRPQWLDPPRPGG